MLRWPSLLLIDAGPLGDTGLGGRQPDKLLVARSQRLRQPLVYTFRQERRSRAKSAPQEHEREPEDQLLFRAVLP
jgi:hypothetical protein